MSHFEHKGKPFPWLTNEWTGHRKIISSLPLRCLVVFKMTPNTTCSFGRLNSVFCCKSRWTLCDYEDIIIGFENDKQCPQTEPNIVLYTPVILLNHIDVTYECGV